MDTTRIATLAEAIQADRATEIEDCLSELEGRDVARVVCDLSDQQQVSMLTAIEPATAAGVLDDLPAPEAIEAVSLLAPETAAAILHEMPSDDQADVVAALDAGDAREILAAMPAAEAEQLADLAAYASDTAGGLMATEVVSFPETETADSVRRGLRKDVERLRRLDIQYAYVTGPRERLVGVLRLRDLLLAQDETLLSAVMIREPLTVNANATLQDLELVFEEHAFLGVPVISDAGALLGVVSRDAVDDAKEDQAASDFRRSLGVVEEEVRSMPALRRSRLRLSWLSVNILLNVVAASVIATYEETLSRVIALAVFLPIISDMSGCSGNQAVAVSMRELSLGLINPAELTRVWLKEAIVGLVNGVALGSLLALVGALYAGNPWLGLVVGAALAANTLIAVIIGGSLPLVLKRLGVDPALASGPILTTVTDMVGFFLVLSLATLLIEKLAAG